MGLSNLILYDLLYFSEYDTQNFCTPGNTDTNCFFI